VPKPTRWGQASSNDRLDVSLWAWPGLLLLTALLGCSDTTSAADATPAPDQSGADAGVTGGGSGGGGGGGGESADQTSYYRVNAIYLRDPHMVADVGFRIDATAEVNNAIAAQLNEDNDGDGLTDIGIVAALTYRGDQVDVTVHAGRCPVADLARCELGEEVTRGTSTVRKDGQCVDFDETTVSDYTPAVQLPAVPCLLGSELPTFLVEAPDVVSLTFTDVLLAAERTDNGLTSGYFRGFLSEDEANQATLGSQIPVVAGQPVSSVLPAADKDGNGWYFYANFSAVLIDLAAAP
jgi:hypothetical protein